MPNETVKPSYTIGKGSPEVAWPPFVEWLREHGVDPSGTTQVLIVPERMVMDVEMYAYTKDGKFHIWNHQILTVTYNDVPLRSEPPRHSSSGVGDYGVL